jgi:hypothetical protein
MTVILAAAVSGLWVQYHVSVVEQTPQQKEGARLRAQAAIINAQRGSLLPTPIIATPSKLNPEPESQLDAMFRSRSVRTFSQDDPR